MKTIALLFLAVITLQGCREEPVHKLDIDPEEYSFVCTPVFRLLPNNWLMALLEPEEIHSTATYPARIRGCSLNELERRGYEHNFTFGYSFHWEDKHYQAYVLAKTIAANPYGDESDNARRRLSYLHYHGNGVSPDIVKGVDLYKESYADIFAMMPSAEECHRELSEVKKEHDSAGMMHPLDSSTPEWYLRLCTLESEKVLTIAKRYMDESNPYRSYLIARGLLHHLYEVRGHEPAKDLYEQVIAKIGQVPKPFELTPLAN